MTEHETRDARRVVEAELRQRRAHALVAGAIGYQHVCRRLLRDFEQSAHRRSDRWYRVFNELSVLLFAAIVVLAVVKPF